MLALLKSLWYCQEGHLAKIAAVHLEMHDEIFHFEIFKKFMKFLKYFKTPFLVRRFSNVVAYLSRSSCIGN